MVARRADGVQRCIEAVQKEAEAKIAMILTTEQKQQFEQLQPQAGGPDAGVDAAAPPTR